MKKESFQVATEREIKKGLTTDVYFDRTVRVLKGTKSSKRVTAEFTVKSLPAGTEPESYAPPESVDTQEEQPVPVAAAPESGGTPG